MLHGGFCSSQCDVQGVFSWKEGRPEPGKTCTLFYNRDASELRHKKDIVVHVGVNGWDSPKKSEVPLVSLQHSDSEASNLGRGSWCAVTCTPSAVLSNMSNSWQLARKRSAQYCLSGGRCDTLCFEEIELHVWVVAMQVRWPSANP
jgi:hypothetical protein